MSTAVIVQARVGSSRLPGKILQSLGARTVIEEVLRRCCAIPGADVVVCAIPDKAADDVIVPFAKRAGVCIFRGSETDVLGRYADAARQVNATIVMRVTSDCPLIDPTVCGDLLSLRARERADYASNAIKRTFPHGLDCEVFTAEALAEAAVKAVEHYDREHVTPWIERAGHFKQVNLYSGDPSLARHRWTLDYPEDLDFVRAVFAALPADSSGAMSDVLAVLKTKPELAEINLQRNVTWPLAEPARPQTGRLP